MVLLGHTDYVLSIAISNDDRLLVSGGGDKKIKIWDLLRSTEICTYDGGEYCVASVAISHN